MEKMNIHTGIDFIGHIVELNKLIKHLNVMTRDVLNMNTEEVIKVSKQIQEESTKILNGIKGKKS